MTPIRIIGAGPAGSSAALAALSEGRAVRLVEKSGFPRHKVCGEFLSPEIAPLLEQLGVWEDFCAEQPTRLGRVALHFEDREKGWTLPEPAFGLSRYTFDHLLAAEALKRGAVEVRETARPVHGCILAHGRHDSAVKGRRLFGFKAHFTGPVNDAVELFFFSGCYVGVSAVEGGRTNVCGLAPEALLREKSFEVEMLLSASRALERRLQPLQRVMDWLFTGPLVFHEEFDGRTANLYLAGDALGFIDPFTGSGILGAVLTGRLAGLAAARGLPPGEHLRQCRHALGLPYRAAGLFRAALGSGAAEMLARMMPGRALYRLTRPRRSA